MRDGDLNVIAEYQYNLYGKEEKATGSFDNPYRYTGQYYDSESGMYYLRARFYDPDLKRFISEDTHWNTGNSIYGDKSYKENEIRYPSSAAMMQSGNLYGYCAGNPVNGCDPTGCYNRKKAVEYAKTWSINAKHGTPRFPNDCTGFMSECLTAGGIEQTNDWFMKLAICGPTFKKNAYKGWNIHKGYWSKTWSVADDQYKWITGKGAFSDQYMNGSEVCIHDAKWVADDIKNYNIQPGDLIYWDWDGDGHIDHASMVVDVSGGDITFAQHNKDENDGSMKEILNRTNDEYKNTYAYVVRIKDNA